MWHLKDQYYERTLMDEHQFNNCVEERIYNTSYTNLIQNEKYVCGYYIVKGQIRNYDTIYDQDTLIWITGGQSLAVSILPNTQLIYMRTKKVLDKDLSYEIYKENQLP